MAAYDPAQQIGLFRWVGIIVGGSSALRQVDWRPSEAQIWVDTPPGRGFWRAGAFCFAAKKVPDYGLHELWRDHFDGMELRSRTPRITVPLGPKTPRAGRVASERLDPIEVVGEPTAGSRTGVVYVLKSAYGYKVGRTTNVPARMRAFGVQLPFAYTIPLCAWFDDNHVAERRYHDLFAHKRINGEWFDLDEADIEQIRLRL
ncbi:GIY-YIG nuclease family protein [Cupriavidus sp. CP313]